MKGKTLLLWVVGGWIAWAALTGDDKPKTPRPADPARPISVPATAPDVQEGPPASTPTQAPEIRTRVVARPVAKPISRTDLPPKPSKPVRTRKPVAVVFVQGTRVPLFAGPGKTFAIQDRLNKGAAVDLLESGPQWSRVRARLTQREG